MYTAKIHRNFFLTGRWAPWPTGTLYLSTPKHNDKSDTDRDRVFSLL